MERTQDAGCNMQHDVVCWRNTQKLRRRSKTQKQDTEACRRSMTQEAARNSARAGAWLCKATHADYSWRKLCETSFYYSPLYFSPVSHFPLVLGHSISQIYHNIYFLNFLVGPLFLFYFVLPNQHVVHPLSIVFFYFLCGRYHLLPYDIPSYICFS